MSCAKLLFNIVGLFYLPYFISCHKILYPDPSYGLETSACRLRYGERGICTIIFHCPSVYYSYNLRTPDFCGFINYDFDFIPIVCCPEVNLELLTNHLWREETTMVDKKPQMNFACGMSPTRTESTFHRRSGWLSRRNRRHVVGGHETAVGQYPWMALIGRRKNAELVWQCDGVFIHPEWVLSAVHCFLENSTYVVRLGEHNINSTTDGASPLDISVLEVIFHPDFKDDIGYHDLAMLKLEKKVPITRSIMPICLPSNREMKLIGTTATLAGWGAHEFGGSLSDVLRDAIVSIYNTSMCDESYSSLPDYETLWPQGITEENIICAGNINGGVDACQGDSGGPLMLRSGHMYKLIGIVAKGFGCGLENFPGIYINVRTYLTWIRETISKNASKKI